MPRGGNCIAILDLLANGASKSIKIIGNCLGSLQELDSNIFLLKIEHHES